MVVHISSSALQPTVARGAAGGELPWEVGWDGAASGRKGGRESHSTSNVRGWKVEANHSLDI